MNKIFLVFLILLIYSCTPKRITKYSIERESLSINSDTIFNITDTIQNIVFKSYYGLTFDSLLNNKYVASYKNFRFVDEPSNCFYSLLLRYEQDNKSIVIYIYPDICNLKHIKRCVDYPRTNWTLDNLRKEIICKVEVLKFN
jgi:hypothetical protein